MAELRVEHGPAPQTQLSSDFTEMAGQLRQVLRTLLKRDGLRPEQVVIVAGLDRKAGQHPEWLYVGASRARAALVLLALDSAGLI